MANVDQKHIGYLLPDDYPIHWDYMYVVRREGYDELLKSHIKGTVKDLKKDLERMGVPAININQYKFIF